MSKDKIEVNMNIYDIPILVEQLEKANKEIERLNKENKELKEQVVSAIRVNNICTENKSFVELQAQRYEQELTITKEKQLKEEIERLNNIINELEKWLKQQYGLDKEEWEYSSPYIWHEHITLEFVLNKLQELKGNNNGVWVNNLLEVIKENNIKFGSDKE